MSILSTIAASRALACGNEQRPFAASPRFQGDRQHAFDRPDAAIERQFADKTEFLERRRV